MADKNKRIAKQNADIIFSVAGNVRGVKDLGDAIGMPTDWDKQNIQQMIRNYNRRHPGILAHTIKEAKQDMQMQSTVFHNVARFGEVDKQAHRRHMFELPEELVHIIEKGYPTMFRSKKHFAWFCENFKQLMLPEER